MTVRSPQSIGQHDIPIANSLIDQLDLFSVKLDVLLRSSFNKLMKLRAHCDEEKMTSHKEARVLFFVELFGHKGVGEIAKQSGYVNSDVSKNLAALARNGFVVKAKQSTTVRMTLTPKGENVVRCYRRSVSMAVGELIRTMPESLIVKRGFADVVKQFNEKIGFARAGEIDLRGEVPTETISEAVARKYNIDLSEEALAKLPVYAAPILPEPTKPKIGIMPR